VLSTPIRLAPQPHWKTATIRPKAAPIESRFISTAFTGTQIERKTIISSSAERSTTTPMKSGSFSAIALPKSSKIALTPPTWICAPVASSTGGIESSRMRSSRSVVSALCGEVVG
jgi:hypothetical protein